MYFAKSRNHLPNSRFINISYKLVRADKKFRATLCTVQKYKKEVNRQRNLQENLWDEEKKPTFAPSESTTLPIEQRTRVELLLYVAK